MFEWIVVSLLLFALVVTLCRRGHRHMLVPWVRWAAVGLGGVAGWLVESMPLTPFRAPLTVTTALAVGVGLFTGRLAAHSMAGWAKSAERDLVAEAVSPAAAARRRLMHPLIGAGLLVFGSFLLYGLAALRFESLEIQTTPRDEGTTIVHGGEEVRIAGDAAVSHGALLIHGFLGSPADFGDLPQRLAERGIGSRSLRLPGHATGPSVLDEVTIDEYLTAVETARQQMAAKYTRVSLVGLSFGGALSVRSASDAAPYRLVVVNPWFGRFVTPPWCPVEADTLLSMAAATTPRVMRPNGMVHVNDGSRIDRLRSYSTIRTRATSEARGFARSAAESGVAAKVTVPTLLLLSEGDRTADPAVGLAWFEALPLPPATKKIVRFGRSDHALFHDFDREEACAAVAAFLAAED